MQVNYFFNIAHSPTIYSIPDFIVLIITIFIGWLIVSVPLYISSKILVRERSSIGNAIFSSFLALIAFLFFFFIVGIFIPPIAPIGGFIGILLIIMIVYKVGFLKAFIMSLIAFIVFILMMIVIVSLGITFSFLHSTLYIRPASQKNTTQ